MKAIFILLLSINTIALGFNVSNTGKLNQVGEGTIELIYGKPFPQQEGVYILQWIFDSLDPDTLIDISYQSNDSSGKVVNKIPVSNGVSKKSLKKGILKWESGKVFEEISIRFSESILDCTYKGKTIKDQSSMDFEIDGGLQKVSCNDNIAAITRVTCDSGFEVKNDLCKRKPIDYLVAKLNEWTAGPSKTIYARYKSRGYGDFEIRSLVKGTNISVFRGKYFDGTSRPVTNGLDKVNITFFEDDYLIVAEGPENIAGIMLDAANRVTTESLSLTKHPEIVRANQQYRLEFNGALNTAKQVKVELVVNSQVYKAKVSYPINSSAKGKDNFYTFFTAPAALPEGDIRGEVTLTHDDGSLFKAFTFQSATMEIESVAVYSWKDAVVKKIELEEKQQKVFHVQTDSNQSLIALLLQSDQASYLELSHTSNNPNNSPSQKASDFRPIVLLIDDDKNDKGFIKVKSLPVEQKVDRNLVLASISKPFKSMNLYSSNLYDLGDLPTEKVETCFDYMSAGELKVVEVNVLGYKKVSQLFHLRNRYSSDSPKVDLYLFKKKLGQGYEAAAFGRFVAVNNGTKVLAVVVAQESGSYCLSNSKN